MGYQRAKWRSGLTYRQTCELCNTTVQYQDDKLGFRPWFPDGFVYGPTCKKPLRHNEEYAIDGPRNSQVNTPETVSATDTSTTSRTRASFCTECGKAFGTNDNFCANCGSKRN